MPMAMAMAMPCPAMAMADVNFVIKVMSNDVLLYLY